MPDLVLTPELASKIVKFLKDDDPKLKHPRYAASVDHAEEMSWHVYGSKPAKLLEKTRPREENEIKEYRLASYQPITKPICKKALNVVYKIFSPNLYSIRFPEDSAKGKQLKEYTETQYPIFRSVVNYVANFLLKKTIADPNAVIIIQPSNYLLKGTEYVKPIATCYSSKDVHWMELNEWVLLYDSTEKTTDGKQYYKYTWVDKQIVAKLILQINSNNELLVTVTDQYAHGGETAPFWCLGGEFSDVESLLYESFFFDAVPFWNKAIDEDSDVDGAYRMHLWPQKWEVTDECEYVEDSLYPCQGGYIFNQAKGSKHKCPNCQGSGFKSAKGPYETHLVNKDRFVNPDGALNLQVPFGYVTVPTDATKMLEEKVDRNLKQGLKALNMDVMDEIGLNQSGKAKEMDRTELNHMLQKIADTFFEIHIHNIYYWFAKYMFIADDPEKIMPEISKPTQFDIYTTSELTANLTTAKTAKVSPVYVRTKQMEIQNREYQTNPTLLNYMNLVTALDPFAEVSRDEIGMMMFGGTAKLEHIVIHDNIMLFVERAMLENPKFSEKPKLEQMAVLEKYAAEVITANKVKIDKSAIEGEDGTNSKVDKEDDDDSGKSSDKD